MRCLTRSLSFLAIAVLSTVPLQGGEIHNAIVKNDLARVKALVEKDPKLVDAPDHENASQFDHTPLIYAIQYNRLKIAKYLLLKKADVNKTPYMGFTPLQTATFTCREKMVDLLLKYKANVNLATRDDTPLMYAIHRCESSIFHKLLKAGADVNATSEYGQTALMYAVTDGKGKIFDAIMAKKPKVNAVDRWGSTALLYAAGSGRKSFIEKLLKGGADAKHKTKKGENALHLVCQFGDLRLTPNERLEVLKMLMKAGANPAARSKDPVRPTSLHLVSTNGDIGAVTLLIGQDVGLNERNTNGDTPLHLAARLGDYYNSPQVSNEIQVRYAAIVATLLKAGADANLQNNQKQTPLQLAVARNNYLAVNSLLPKTKSVKSITPVTGESFLLWCCRHGLDKALTILVKKEKVDLSQKNSDGETPLVLACEGKSDGHAAVVKLLIDKGAKVNQKLGTGETVLHVAAWNGNAKMVQALLTAKADFSAMDKSGYSPLHLAAWNGHADAVTALLKAGASADANVSGGSTPLHAAAWKGHSAVVKALLVNKANVSSRDGDGLTPLHKAAWNGHINVVRALVEAGAEVNAKDNDGYTPTVKAREQKKAAVVAYLKSKGGVDSAKK